MAAQAYLDELANAKPWSKIETLSKVAIKVKGDSTLGLDDAQKQTVDAVESYATYGSKRAVATTDGGKMLDEKYKLLEEVLKAKVGGRRRRGKTAKKGRGRKSRLTRRRGAGEVIGAVGTQVVDDRRERAAAAAAAKNPGLVLRDPPLQTKVKYGMPPGWVSTSTAKPGETRIPVKLVVGVPDDNNLPPGITKEGGIYYAERIVTQKHTASAGSVKKTRKPRRR